jgi:hypothetical protein
VFVSKHIHKFENRYWASVITSPAFSLSTGTISVCVIVFHWFLKHFQFRNVCRISSDSIATEVRLHRLRYFQQTWPKTFEQFKSFIYSLKVKCNNRISTWITDRWFCLKVRDGLMELRPFHKWHVVNMSARQIPNCFK